MRRRRPTRARSPRRVLARCLLLAALASLSGEPGQAGVREQARRMHDRLVGTPPSESVLSDMAQRIQDGMPLQAAHEAMADPAFYNSTLKNWITPWTNEERSIFDELNDYTATVIGLIRDDRDFTEVLSGDVIYVGAPGVVASAYSHTNNDHYRQLEESRADLANPAVLRPVPQSSLPGSQLGPGDAAGVMTTRAAGKAFFSAGTNRRMWRFVGINYLCRDLEELKDVSRPADRIRQDVSRSPGGDSALFHQGCTGCHSGMDPLAQAFAYFEWDADQERVIHTPGYVQPKYLINDNTFPGGFVTLDNRWDNFWRSGPNASLGWRAAEAGGFGAQSLGVEVASSRAFSECQVRKVFEQVCFRSPGSEDDYRAIATAADNFEVGGYRMKDVFAEIAVYCMGN